MGSPRQRVCWASLAPYWIRLCFLGVSSQKPLFLIFGLAYRKLENRKIVTAFSVSNFYNSGKEWDSNSRYSTNNNNIIPLVGRGCKKNMLIVWSQRFVGGDCMVQGSLVGDPPLASFFLFFSVFRSALHPIWAHKLTAMGLGVSSSVPRSLSFSSLFSLSILRVSFLSVDACRPRNGGI